MNSWPLNPLSPSIITCPVLLVSLQFFILLKFHSISKWHCSLRLQYFKKVLKYLFSIIRWKLENCWQLFLIYKATDIIFLLNIVVRSIIVFKRNWFLKWMYNSIFADYIALHCRDNLHGFNCLEVKLEWFQVMSVAWKMSLRNLVLKQTPCWFPQASWIIRKKF